MTAGNGEGPREKTMSRIIVDGVLLSKLHNLAEPLELCDGSGRVLGRLIPEGDLSKYEYWEPEISKEELRCSCSPARNAIRPPKQSPI